MSLQFQARLFLQLSAIALLFCLPGTVYSQTLPPQAVMTGRNGPGDFSRAFSSNDGIFRQNIGQWDGAVRFRSSSAGTDVAFLDRSVRFCVRGAVNDTAGVGRFVWGIDFDGSGDETCLHGIDPEPSNEYYFSGFDRREEANGIPHSTSILYSDLYPSIDLKYYNEGDRIRYDYLIHPGGNLAAIRMAYRGVKDIAITEEGALEIRTEMGTVTERAPVSYQEFGGKRLPVDVRYRLLNDSTVGFAVVGRYRPEATLVIDPVILEWSTFVGGSQLDADGYIRDICSDAAGNVYVTGYYGGDFPTTPGAVPTTASNRSQDIFVFKMSPDGKSLLFSSYFGGHGRDVGTAISLNPFGDVIVAGLTTLQGETADFPVLPDGYDPEASGFTDNFVMRLSGDGRQLLGATLLGGNGEESADLSVATDDFGDIYVAGSTSSPDFPTTDGSSARFAGIESEISRHAYLVRLSQDCRDLRFGTIIGDVESATVSTAMTVDGTDTILCLATRSAALPVSSHPAYIKPTAEDEASYICRVSTTGDSIRYGTYFPGFISCVTRSSGGAIVIGGTINGGGLPFTPQVFSKNPNGSEDGFVASISSDCSFIRFATYLGGTLNDRIEDIVTFPGGEIIVSGTTISPIDEFPTSTCSEMLYAHGGDKLSWGVFTAALDRDGTTLHHLMIIDGESNDYRTSLARTPSDDSGVYLGLTTHSRDFPTTPGAYQPIKLNGGNDQPVVMKLAPVIEPDFTPSIGSCGQVSFTDRTRGECIWGTDNWSASKWFWDFGDGTTSDERNPVHTYAAPGTYQVSLVAGLPNSFTSMTVEVPPFSPTDPIRSVIPQNVGGNLGDTLIVPVALDENPARYKVRSIEVTLRFDSTMLRLPDDAENRMRNLLKGTMLEGWNLVVTGTTGRSITAVATAPAGRTLEEPGTLFRIPLYSFLRQEFDLKGRDDVPFDVQATLVFDDDAGCLLPSETSGLVVVGGCGLGERLIYITFDKYRLQPGRPNPAEGLATIEFELGLDGETTLDIVNVEGVRVKTLLKERMGSGVHRIV